MFRHVKMQFLMFISILVFRPEGQIVIKNIKLHHVKQVDWCGIRYNLGMFTNLFLTQNE